MQTKDVSYNTSVVRERAACSGNANHYFFLFTKKKNKMKSFCILEKDCVRVHFLFHQVKIVELIRKHPQKHFTYFSNKVRFHTITKI